MCHSGPDKRQFAATLSKRLWDAGIAAFLDDHNLELGDQADSVMQAQVCSAQIVVFVLSEAFFQTAYTLQELHWATTTGQRLFPVFLGIQPDSLEAMLAHVTQLDFTPESCSTVTAEVEALFRITGLREESFDGCGQASEGSFLSLLVKHDGTCCHAWVQACWQDSAKIMAELHALPATTASPKGSPQASVIDHL